MTNKLKITGNIANASCDRIELKMIIHKIKNVRSLVMISILHLAALAVNAQPYLSPTDICASPNGSIVYIAELSAGKVAVFNTVTQAVTYEIVLPDPNQASGVAISPNGSRLYVTASDPNGKVYVINTATNGVIDTISVGHTPMSPVVSPDATKLYVCNRFDNTVSIITLATKVQVVVPVTREPVSAALTPNGNTLVVCNLLPADATSNQFISAKVSIINTATATVTASIRLPNGSSSLYGVCVSPDGLYAYVVHLLGKYQVTPNQVEHGWTWTNMLSIINLNTATLVSTVLLDDLDLGAGNPRDVQCTSDGQFIVVAHAGTHEISVIDRVKLHTAITGRQVNDVAKDFSLLVNSRSRIALKGKGPRSLALVGNKAYIGEFFTGTVGIVDFGPAVRPKSVSIIIGSEPEMTVARKGELIYNDATLSFQRWLSCSSCHPGARSDGLNWDEQNDGFGNAKQTKSHLYSHFTPPTTILGIRASAEISVRAGLKYAYFNILPESSAVAVDEYLKGLTPVPSPYLVNGQLSAAAVRGKVLFDGAAGCSTCHSGPTYYTDMQKHNVGTGFGSRDLNALFDTPTLAEIWRTAPYLYRGQAATIVEVLTVFNAADQHGTTSALTPQQIVDLAEYVLSIGTE